MNAHSVRVSLKKDPSSLHFFAILYQYRYFFIQHFLPEGFIFIFLFFIFILIT